MARNYGNSGTGEGRGMSAALLLEMSAEATRDPQIAAALDHFDATLRAAIVDWLTRSPERSEEHTSELQSLMRNSYAVFCLKKKNKDNSNTQLLYANNSNTHLTHDK